MDNLESARLDAMEKTLEENQEQNLQWVSNIAATLVRMDQQIVRMDRRIEENALLLKEQKEQTQLLREMLQEMRNERGQNGSGRQ